MPVTKGSSSVFQIADRHYGYTRVPNDTARDYSLSCKALGMLTRLLSNVDGWRIDSRSLAQDWKEGRDAVLAMTKELIEHGYITRTRTHTPEGYWLTKYTVYAEPQRPTPVPTAAPMPDMPDNDASHDSAPDQANMQVRPRPGFPDPVNPDSANPDPEKPDVSKRPRAKEQDEEEGAETARPNEPVDNSYQDPLAGWPAVSRVADELARRGVTPTWHGLKRPELLSITETVGRCGWERVVDHAVDRNAVMTSPAFHARAFIASWKGLRGEPVSLPETATKPSGPKPFCGECDRGWVDDPSGDNAVIRCKCQRVLADF